MAPDTNINVTPLLWSRCNIGPLMTTVSCISEFIYQSCGSRTIIKYVKNFENIHCLVLLLLECDVVSFSNIQIEIIVS